MNSEGPDLDLILIAGAPGSGKSTLCRELQRRLDSPFIEFSSLRQPHLDATWSNASKAEEEMAFENLVFVVDNYVRHGYRNVIVTDLRDERVTEVPARFPSLAFRIVSLVLRDEEELRSRIERRFQGFTDVEEAIRRNRAFSARPLVTGETRVEADGLTVEELSEIALSSTR